jgi:hypothetical protein
VKEGRFEFLNGGWSANDEACPAYEDILDNMMTGHRFLQKEFGVIPRVGWLLDSFGHSSANARLYADMGFDALFVGRIDQGERNKRIKERSMNFLWRPFTKHFGDKHQLLVSVFNETYCYPPGFSVDERYDADDPFVSDATLRAFNADEKARQLINYVQAMSKIHDLGENHILLPWGCDFTFANAKLSFDQMDRIIKYLNQYNKQNITF